MTVGNVIGEAFVEIRPELSKLFRETSEGVSKAVDEAAKKQESSFDKVSKVGQAAFVGLTTAAVGFGAAAVKEALEGEKAHALLEAAVHGAGASMEGLEPKIEALSAKFAKLGFVNDEVEAGLARLTQITQSPTRAIELMGVTADLARARHIGLEQAANLVGRAAEGNVTALKRMGIEIQTTGDKAKDGEAAIAELQKRFGGAAQAEAGTYAGKLAAFRAEVTNLEERIGEALLPKLAALAGGLAGTVDFLEHNRAAAIALGAVIGGPLVASMGAWIASETIAIGLKFADFLETVAIGALYVADGLNTASTAAYVYATSLAAAIGPIELTAAAVALLTGAVTIDTTNTKAATNEAKAYIQTIQGSGDEVTILKDRINTLSKQRNDEYLATARAATANGTWQKVAGKAREVYDQQTAGIDALKSRLKDLEEKQKGSTQAHSDAAAAAAKQGHATKDLAAEIGQTADMVDLLAKKLGIDLAKATDADLDKIKDLGDRLQIGSANGLALSDAMAKLADKTSDATERASAFDTALERLVGGNIDAEKALVNLYNAVDGLGAKIKANAASFDVHTKAGRDDITMVEDAVTSINSHIEAMQRQGFTADQIKQAFAGDTEELRKQLEQTGLTKTQVDKLLVSYGLVPGSINTIVTAETTDAQKAWNDLMASAQPYLDALAKLPKAEIKGAASTVTVPHFASGGFVPGPAGQAIPAIVHAGEFVLSRDMLRTLTKPAQAGPAPIPAGPLIGQLVVHEAAGAYQTGVEVARQLRSEVYRRTGR